MYSYYMWLLVFQFSFLNSWLNFTARDSVVIADGPFSLRQGSHCVTPRNSAFSMTTSGNEDKVPTRPKTQFVVFI